MHEITLKKDNIQSLKPAMPHSVLLVPTRTCIRPTPRHADVPLWGLVISPARRCCKLRHSASWGRPSICMGCSHRHSSGPLIHAPVSSARPDEHFRASSWLLSLSHLWRKHLQGKHSCPSSPILLLAHAHIHTQSTVWQQPPKFENCQLWISYKVISTWRFPLKANKWSSAERKM